MPAIRDTDLRKYVGASEIRILRKAHVGTGVFLPGRRSHYGEGLFLPGTEGDGFLDSLLSVGKTISNNIGLIKDVGQAVGSAADAGSKIANLVKATKSQEKEDLTEDYNQYKSLQKQGGGFLYTK